MHIIGVPVRLEHVMKLSRLTKHGGSTVDQYDMKDVDAVVVEETWKGTETRTRTRLTSGKRVARVISKQQVQQ
jgi:hypothetical protein